MARFIEPVSFKGEHVALEPLQREHASEMAEAARDGELWRLWYTAVPSPDTVTKYIDIALDMRERLGAMPFVVREPTSGRLVGSTRYFNVEAQHRRLEIGHTWYGKSVQRTPLNTECKLLLLTHAFETLSCIAVEFRTHWMNHQSRAAIARLGARQDGVLRNHQIGVGGTLRDTVVFSIIQSEWPTVKQHLLYKLGRLEC